MTEDSNVQEPAGAVLTAGSKRNLTVWILAGLGGTIAVIVAIIATTGKEPRANSRDAAQIARGEAVYRTHCASCHGANLDGQPGWRRRLPNGRLPAPPHNDSGHTWHHGDELLFRITKQGLVPPIVPEGYQTDMPGFALVLSDEDIWAALAFIKSRWSKATLAARKEMLQGSGRR